MTKIKEKLNNYQKPTPKRWRQLGDSLLGTSTFITGFAIYSETPWLAYTALSIGVVGKFLTNFFKEEK